MGTTAENVARAYQITREMQDELALASQQKASAAQKAGRFADEIAPVTIAGRKGDVVVSEDEYIRHDSSAAAMAKLRPAFSKDGSVTAGNASGINDGACALVVMSGAEAARRGLTPLARIASFATAGVDPALMGTGPIPSARKALERAGWSVGDLDLPSQISSTDHDNDSSSPVLSRPGSPGPGGFPGPSRRKPGSASSAPAHRAGRPRVRR